MSASANELSVRMHDISKAFGANVANNKAGIEVACGSIHALVGENGAGKSTLMKILFGQVRADSGEIQLLGKKIDLAKHTPREAIRRGVGMVHQHFMLVDTLSVAENILLGRSSPEEETADKGLWLARALHSFLASLSSVDIGAARTRIKEMHKEYGLEADPDAIVGELSVGQRQRVEILKVLYDGCQVLVLDEPTAVLTPSEVEQLFAMLRVLAAAGTAIIIITHKLDEVVSIADEITVMRKGEVITSMSGADATPAKIAKAMVGRDVVATVKRGRQGSAYRSGGEGEEERPNVIMEGKGLHVRNNKGLLGVEDLSFALRAGEILGVAGVEGNGQSELQECIVGLRPIEQGSLRVSGQEWAKLSVANRYGQGLAHVPEDRHDRAVVLEFSNLENYVLGRQFEFQRGPLLDWAKARKFTEEALERADVHPCDPDLPMASLSGGNQQKIVMARELERAGTVVLLCSQPTRGVDIGAIEKIHQRILDARDAGLAVLLFSAELSELFALSDRMVVMYEGQIRLELDETEVDREDARDRVAMAMTGGDASK